MKYIQHIVLVFIVLFSIVFAQDMSGIKICIDPGHGGHESDDRHMVFADFWESESNLSKALYLEEILANLGATVILTRHGNGDSGIDNDPSLSERAAIANQNNVDFFNSIHSNGYNGELNYTLMLYRGWNPGVTGTNYGSTVTGALYPLAGEMADIMANEIYVANNTTAKHVRGDWSFYSWTDSQGNKMGLGVLRPLNMAGTLSEGSFHDYPPETWRLQNLDYRKSEAWALARSFVKLNNAGDFSTHNLAGIVRDSYEKVSYFSLNGTSDAYKPVNNITVTLNPGGKLYQGDANNNGYFLFDSLNAGDYELIVAVEGYYPDTAQVTIGSSFYNFKDFRIFSKIPPIVASAVPADGDTSFPAWDPIVIQFSRPMNTTLTGAAISISPEEPLEFTWLNDGLKLEIRSDSLDFLSEYTITIAGTAQDIFGHQFDGNGDGIGGDLYSFTFTTGKEDMAAPQIVRMYPGLNARDVELLPVINITFDEELDTNSIMDGMVFMQNYPEYDTIPTIVEHFIVNHQSVFNVFPMQELEHDKLHKVRVIEGLRDLFGNEITRKKTITFRTGVERWVEKKIDDFESGLTTNWKSPKFSGSTVGLIDTLGTMAGESQVVNHLTGSLTSMAIRYGWNQSSSEWLLREYLGGGAPRNITFNKNYIMQAYVFGDGSRTPFRFAVDDKYPTETGANHEVSPWYTIDWIGWKLVSWDMTNDSTGTWLGDGNLDGTLRFDSFQLSYNPDDPDALIMGEIYIDDLRLVTIEQVGINAEIAQIPAGFTLYQNYPNPFNPTTTISFTLAKASNVRLEIFNIRGEKVRSLANEYFHSGYWTAVWDGKNDNGLSVPSGMYMYRMITGTGIQVKNMLLLK
jgi:N-acetylmuramoyl-L-alanine amidase